MLKVMVKPMLEQSQILEGLEAPEEIVYRELNSEALTGQDVILCMASIIDLPGWEILDTIDAEARKMDRLTMRQSKVTTRSEKMALISNGRNTIQLLDWKETSTIVTHDPIVRVIGPDAFQIANTFLSGLLAKLSERLFKIEFDETAAKDIATLTERPLEEIMSLKTDLETTAESFRTSVMG